MAGNGSSDNFDEKYTYDSLNQLTAFDRGELSGGKISSPIFGQSWNPDALGNFESVTNTTYGSSTITENRTHNRQNQLGTLTITGSSTTTLSFDNAGSMNQSVFAEQGKSAVTTTFTLDAWNRTINFKGSGRYAYDPLNRRIKEDTKALFYSNNWQVLEERTSGTVSFRYAWSPVYVDAMIARDEYTSGSMSERLYATTDANYNVTALISTAGAVDERFGYDPYGSVKLLDNTWGSVTVSANGWVYLHQDGRLDESTGMYHFRNRDADADLMRWSRPTHAAYVAFGPNLQTFVSNNPLIHIDPMALGYAFTLQQPATKLYPGEENSLKNKRCDCSTSPPALGKPAGQVMCKNGQLVPWINPAWGSRPENLYSGITECAIEHEMHHIAQITAICGNPCKKPNGTNVPDGWRVGITYIGPDDKSGNRRDNCRDISECYAHVKEIDCLIGKLSGGDPLGVILDRIAFLRKKMVEYHCFPPHIIFPNPWPKPITRNSSCA